jgi:iron complex outermembrane recepter protein
MFYNRPQWRLSVKVNNITNEKYWVSDSYLARPQATTNILASVAFKF